ncbi:YSIRK-type signal peptide-containing protein [Lactobacillus johnsonii]|uniref:YSIRK-type signal peptide-containing protein n=1 Tax=Lactobacillus johnsonii TaxID=33959 RepID=UPI000B99045F|nr:YSIRK-type signal peptide-containing protein [Lactobacillus johnsonii]OYS01633.1 hypothetical protein CBF54_08975 [Lactobacillus johnsonii]OYS06242.1 hypothetical protein CBF62_07785 [Lactobacillus johnsonii]OYS06637.1 hypothetical protein CBF63_09080 [Lactobacillus johnsonii]OYS06730.1 hypothetical protein CBF65_08585 [Lactobacillus johnsonii]OYS12225.1 hypothetical protein CBF48_07010 [Lactobacillus johnsonii]
MFSKNLQRFSIRKLSIGVASVLIGSSLMIINDNNYAKAATNNDRSTQSLNRRITEDQVQNSLNNAKAKQAAEAQKQSQAHTTLTQSQEKLNNLQAQNKAVQTQLNSELAKTPQLEQNVKDKSDQLAQINQKVQEKQVVIATAQKADKTAQKQTNIDPKYQQAVNNAQTEKANIDAKVTNANKALDQNTYDYKAVMDKVAEAQRTINHAQEQTNSLHQQVTEANKTQQKAQAAADKAYQEYQDANAKYNEANKAYTEKTQALDDAKKKNSDAISINGKHASISTIDSNKTTVKPVANPSVKAPTDTKELLNQAKEKLNEPTLTESQHESLKKSLNKLETKVNNDSNSIKADNQLPVEQSVTKVNNEESDPMINSKSVMASTKHNVPSVTNSTYEAKLPQTSDNKVEAAVLTGFGVVISMFGLVGTRRKKN